MKKVAYLDGLRGFCAAIVVLHHFGNMFFPAISNGTDAIVHHPFELTIHNSLLSMLFDGNLAVCFFFVIGGFVLTYKYFVKSVSQNIITSIVKRYFRMSIPVFGAVFIVYILMKANLFFHLDIMESTKSYWTITFWRFTPGFIDMIKKAFYDTFIFGDNKYLVILWTMKIEFLSSVVLYLALPFMKNRITRIALYIVTAVLTYKTYYVAFLFGVILCDYYSCFKKEIDSEKNVIRNTLSIGILALGLWIGGTGAIFSYTQHTVLKNIIAASIIILAVMHSTQLRMIFSTKIALFLGKISFSMYLTHLLILTSLSSYIFRNLIFTGEYMVATLIVFIVSILTIISVAYLFTISVDSFAVNTSNWISKKTFRK